MSVDRRFKLIGSGLPGSVDFVVGDLSDQDFIKWDNTNQRWTSVAYNATGIDHGGLAGLGDDDHGAVYPGISQAETITGAWTYSGTQNFAGADTSASGIVIDGDNTGTPSAGLHLSYTSGTPVNTIAARHGAAAGPLTVTGSNVTITPTSNMTINPGAAMTLSATSGITVSSQTTFSAGASVSCNDGLALTGTSQRIDIQNGQALRVRDSTDADYADFSHDGTDFNVDFTNTNNLEFNTVNEIFSTSDGGASYRGIHPRVYLQRNDSAHTLTSTTSQQKIFGNANGALTLETGTYYFDCKFRISGLSSTSGNGTFSILGAGTATLAGQNWHWIGTDVTADTTTIFTPDMGWSNGNDTSGVGGDMFTAGTGTRMNAHCWGTFEVSVSGTLIPSITLTTAAAGTVAIGSYFRVWRAGGTGLTTIGNAS